MTEQYPSDAELNALSGTTDSEQGVVYPSIYEAPYYTTFYKMLSGLLNVSRRGGDLRIFGDGTLSFGVRAGNFFNGDSVVNYAGAAEQSLTDNSTNYIYLTAAGTLTVNTTGFPVPSVSPHIRLATIVTASGTFDLSDIIDYRGTSFLSVAGAASGNLNSLDWQESVADELDFTAAEPGSPTLGDRYLNTGSGASSGTAQTVAANDIEQWNGTSWTEITPTKGACCLVEDTDMLTAYNGSAWVDIGTFALLSEAQTFFAATDITGAEAEILTDGSNADAKHVHDTAGITADAIDGTKIADDSIGSEHFLVGAPYAAFVVAANNSLAKVKNSADYTCDGTADDVQIQAAIDLIDAAGGGELFLVAGTYTLAATVTVPDNVTISGEGRATILTVANSVNDSIFENDDTGGGNSNIVFRDFHIAGNDTNNANTNAHGIFLDNVSNFLIENVTATETYGYGFHINDSSYGSLKNCRAWDSGNEGGFKGVDATDVTWSNCRSYGHVGAGGYGYFISNTTGCQFLYCTGNANSDDGLALLLSDNTKITGGSYSNSTADKGAHITNTCTNTTITGVTFSGNTKSGLEAGPDCVISQCTISDNTENGIWLGGDNNTVSECTISGNGQRGIRSTYYTPNNNQILKNKIFNNGQSGIELENHTNLIISGNIFYDDQGTPTQDYAIETDANCGGPIWIKENIFGTHQTGILSLAGSNDVVKSNIGYATESGGSSTGTGSQQTIAHGLAVTPTFVTISGDATDVNGFQSAAADATNIYITADNTEAYHWKAEVL